MHRITDVERLKKKVRQMAAGKVLSGDYADVCQDLAQMDGCRVCLAAGYGAPDRPPQHLVRDRLIWILEGYIDITQPDGKTLSISQGDSVVLKGGTAYGMAFPNLTIYLSVEVNDMESQG